MRSAHGTLLEAPRAVATAALAAGLIIAQFVAGKAVRDGLFLWHFGVTALAPMMAASAIVSIGATLVATRLVARFGPARIVPVMFVAHGLTFLVDWILLDAYAHAVAVLLYLHTSVLGSIGISGFWSVINERFDPHSAKRQVGRIAAGATLGGVVGGLLAERLAHTAGLASVLLALTVSSLLAATVVARLGDARDAGAGETGGPLLGLRVLRRQPYLRHIALLIGIVAAAAAFADYALRAKVSVSFHSQESIARFFSIFYGISALATFLAEILVVRPIITRLGVARSIAILPLSTAIVGGVGTLFGSLGAATALKSTETVLSNAIFRPAYEVLYTPIKPAEKRSAKLLIDVAIDRVGEAVAGGLILVLITLFGTGSASFAFAAAAFVSAAALVVARRLPREYLDSLEGGLGAIPSGQNATPLAMEGLDHTGTFSAIARDQLLDEVRRYRAQRLPSWPEPVETRGHSEPPSIDRLADAIRVLAAGDLQGSRRLFEAPLTPPLIALAIPLLGDDSLSAAITRSLTEAADRYPGQLVDGLLDPEQPPVVRRRLAIALRGAGSPVAVRGLLDALSDPRFEVRAQCAAALSEIRWRHPQIAIDEGEVRRALMRELEVDRDVWEERNRLAESAESPPWLDAVILDRLHRSLAHVFTLLGLVIDPKPLGPALQALVSTDEVLRGVALEYLENAVPEPIRSRLWPYLTDRRVVRDHGRTRREILADLREGLGETTTPDP